MEGKIYTNTKLLKKFFTERKMWEPKERYIKLKIVGIKNEKN